MARDMRGASELDPRGSMMPSNGEIELFVWGWEIETFSLAFAMFTLKRSNSLTFGLSAFFFETSNEHISLSKLGNSIFILFL